MAKRKPSLRQEIKKLNEQTRAPIEIAVDTEYDGAHTLTTQLVRRRDRQTLELQIYRSPEIPKPSDVQRIAGDISEEHKCYASRFDRLVVRSMKAIKSSLSPATIVENALRLKHSERVSRDDANSFLSDQALDLQHAIWDGCRAKWRVPFIRLFLVAHFWTADFLRVFGSDIYSALLHEHPRIRLRKKPTLSLVEGSGFGGPPILEYLKIGDDFLCGICIETADNILPFGKGSLDRHSQTFLGIGKSGNITAKDKASMAKTFDVKTDEAYGGIF